MILISFVEDPRTGFVSQRVVIPDHRMTMGVSLRIPEYYEGRYLNIGVSAAVMGPPAHKELKFWPCVSIEGDWWRLPHCLLPSRRTLAEILVDAVQHGVDNPRHGSNCSCMDTVVWELRRHIDRALPEVQSRTEADPYSPEPTVRYEPNQWEANMAARQRVYAILAALGRNL